MDNKWKVELYENSRGQKLIEEFIDSLETKSRLKVTRAFELMKAFGLEGGYPHIKKLTGTNLVDNV